MISLDLRLPLVEGDVGDQSENQHDTILDVDFVNVEASKKLDAEEGGEDDGDGGTGGHRLADSGQVGRV